LQVPPTVAVLKGVIADGTPRCGSAVLTKTVAAVQPTRQIELIRLLCPSNAGTLGKPVCLVGARGKALAPRELDLPGAFFVVQRGAEMSDDLTTEADVDRQCVR